MAIQTPGLDRLQEMQRQPLGTFSALRRPSPVASQYRRQSEMYGQALRNLSREARKGNSGAAMAAIKVREDANEKGFAPGSIGRSEDRAGAIQGREQEMMRSNDMMQREDAFNRNTLDRRLVEPMGPPASARNTRTSAALDLLEGRMGGDGTGPESDQYIRGKDAAVSLGVENPDSILTGDRKLKYRQTLDTALGEAKTPEEIAALKERGTKYGISMKAFDRRAKWWETNR